MARLTIFTLAVKSSPLTNSLHGSKLQIHIQGVLVVQGRIQTNSKDRDYMFQPAQMNEQQIKHGATARRKRRNWCVYTLHISFFSLWQPFSILSLSSSCYYFKRPFFEESFGLWATQLLLKVCERTACYQCLFLLLYVLS